MNEAIKFTLSIIITGAILLVAALILIHGLGLKHYSAGFFTGCLAPRLADYIDSILDKHIP